MTEFRDLSRLPANQAYWDGLAARIADRLGPRVRAAVTARTRWWAPTTRGTWLAGGLAVAATLAALLLTPPRIAPESPAPTGLLRAPKEDPATLAFVTAPAPPSLALLVISSTGSTR
jgi:hypothetical protein